MNDDNPFLEALEALVNPQRSKVLQDGPIGSGLAGTRTVSVVLPSRLAQLEEAIRGTIGKGGSGALPSQRNMLDADALFRFSKISSTIKDWAHMAGAKITQNDAAATLRAWYVAYTAKPVTMESERFYIREMTSWANQIDAKLNPPRVWETPGACPVCGAETWWSKSTHEEYKFPLVVEYFESGPNLIQEARAMCRACEAVFGVRELAYLLETAESNHEEDHAV
jgi:hypothetical protein